MIYMEVLKPTSSFMNFYKFSTSNSPLTLPFQFSACRETYKSVSCLRNWRQRHRCWKDGATNSWRWGWSRSWPYLLLYLCWRFGVSQNPKSHPTEMVDFCRNLRLNINIHWASQYCIYRVSERFHARVLKHPTYTVFYEKKTPCSQPWHSVNHDPVF